MGSNRWLQSTSYPPPETTVQTWVVDLENRSLSTEDGTTVRRDISSRHHSLTLNPQDPTPSTGGIALGDDVGPLSQSELVARPEVMHVASQPLERDVTIIGEPKLTGTISQGTCAPDLAVTMVDIFPDGGGYLVTEGIRRIRSGIESIEVSLWPTAYTFKQGHRIGLVLAPAKFPKYALPPCVTSSQEGSPSLTLLEPSSTQWKLRAGTLP
jgi:putative CocE/NonD family hydrolase